MPVTLLASILRELGQFNSRSVYRIPRNRTSSVIFYSLIVFACLVRKETEHIFFRIKEQKRVSEKIGGENTKIPSDVYHAIMDMFALVKFNGVGMILLSIHPLFKPFRDKYKQHLKALYARIQDGIPEQFLANERFPSTIKTISI